MGERVSETKLSSRHMFVGVVSIASPSRCFTWLSTVRSLYTLSRLLDRLGGKFSASHGYRTGAFLGSDASVYSLPCVIVYLHFSIPECLYTGIYEHECVSHVYFECSCLLAFFFLLSPRQSARAFLHARTACLFVCLFVRSFVCLPDRRLPSLTF